MYRILICRRTITRLWTTLELLKYKSEECVTVAAHAYDVRGAKAMGMKTIYVRLSLDRLWTDDIREDHEIVKGEFNAYPKSMGLVNSVEKL